MISSKVNLEPYYNDAPRPRMSASRLEDIQHIPRCFDILSALPVELSLRILCFIPEPSTFGRLSVVCKAWNILIQDESIWRLQCRRFSYAPTNHREGPEDWNGWKKYFIKLYILGKIHYILNSWRFSGPLLRLQLAF